MRTQTVHVTHDFAKPPERIFAYLSEHENLEPLFGAKITRLNDGDAHRNGINSRRKLQIAPVLPAFEETVTEFSENERIVYAISGGITPLTEHLATQVFTPTPSGGTHLDYTIRLGSPLPLLALVVKAVLQRNIGAALPKADEAA